MNKYFSVLLISLVSLMLLTGKVYAADGGLRIFSVSVGTKTAKWGNTYSFSFYNGDFGAGLMGSTRGQLSSYDLSYYPPYNSVHSVGEKTVNSLYGGYVIFGRTLPLGRSWYISPAATIGAIYYRQANVYESNRNHIYYAQTTNTVYKAAVGVRFFAGSYNSPWVVGGGYSNIRGAFVTVGYRFP